MTYFNTCLQTTITALCIALTFAVGCGDDTADGSGGSGGSGGGDQGGSGGQGGAESCPAGAPTHGAPCESSLSCSYEVTPEGCASAQSFEAACVNGNWDALQPATCGAVENPGCEPAGTYALSYSEWDPMEVGVTPSALEIGESEGALYTNIQGAVFKDSGCTLEASWTDEYCEEIDGQMFCSYETYDLTLDFSQQPVTGTLGYECNGECGGTATAVVTAQ